MRDFDDILRSKLAGAQASGRPDWAALRGRLDEEAFDEHLRAALVPLAVAPTQLHADQQWDSLAAKLDAAAEVEGDVFDRLIAGGLAHREPAVAPQESWRVLSRRMDTLWPLRRVLVRYRVHHVAAAALLVFSFLPLLRDNPVWEPSADDAAVAATGGRARGDGDPLDAGQQLVLTGADSDVAADGVAVPADFVAVAGALRPAEIAQLLNGLSAGNVDAAVLGALPVLPPTSTLEAVWEAIRADVFGQRASSDGHAALSAGVAAITPATASTPVREEWPLSLKPLTSFPTTQPILALPKTVARPSVWHYGVSGGARLTQVSTPPDPEFDRPNVRRVHLVTPQLGMHLAANLSPRTRLGLSTGFTSLSYSPGLRDVTRSSTATASGFDYTESFSAISYDMGQGVVDLRRAVLPKGRRMQLWGKVGAGANVVLGASYNFRRTLGFAPVNTPPELDPPGFNSTTGPRKGNHTKIFSESKDFALGLFQGEKFIDTRQFFGRVGLEGEYRINKRIRVFGALDLDAAITGGSGLGPNRDRYSALTSELGARVSL